MLKNSALTVILLLVTLVFGQSQTRSFSALNVKNGLSQSSVLTIVQDHDGFMWFGTRYGLNRYDGQRFKVYNHNLEDEHSLSDNYINILYKDRKGNLWVGTANGLQRYDVKKDRFTRLKLKGKPQSNSALNIQQLVEDHLGNLWVGTERGLFYIPKGASPSEVAAMEALDPLTKDIGADILALYEDRQKTIWVSSSKGLYNLTYSNTWTLNKIESLEKLPKTVKSIVEDDFGNIWFGSELDGLYVLNPKNQQVENIRKIPGQKNTLIHDVIRKIIICRDGQLAIGTMAGVSLYDVKTRSFTNFVHDPEDINSLSQNSVYALYEDYQGSLWVGTYFGGVNIAERHVSPFHDLFSENSAIRHQHQVIRAIHATKGGVWIGSEGGGLSLWNAQNNTVNHYKIDKSGVELSTSLIKSLLIDRKEQVWVGTSGGGLKLVDKTGHMVSHYDLGLDAYKLKRSAILSMYEDRDGQYWFGGLGYNRIYRQKGKELIDVTPQAIRDTFAKQTIVSFLEGRQGELWILAEKRLYRYDLKKQTLRLELEANDGFNCIFQDHKGILWIGKYNGGLIAYDNNKKQEIARWNKGNGLTNNNVVGIVEDAGKNLWISTQSGLNKLDANRRYLKSLTNLDGIKNDAFHFNAIYLDGKTLYLGSLNGLTYFNVDAIKENTHLGNLVFSGLRLFGGDLVQPATGNPLLQANIVHNPVFELDPNQRVFTVEFALLSYIKQDKNRYAYLLEGTSDKWILTDKGEATFTNLPAGDYSLLVKAQNNDGIWTEVKKLSFTVLPPLWKTWWAYLCYFAVICFVVFIIIRYFYLQGLRQKDRQLHQLKMNFFTNISHEIRSHLTLIMTPIENAIYHSSQTSSLESYLLQAKDSSNRLLRLVNELMDFRKAESKKLQLQLAPIRTADLLDGIALQFEGLCKNKEISFHYSNQLPQMLVELDVFQFEKVIFNLLNNALKYTTAGGYMKLEVDKKDKDVVISVENTGKGIDPIYFERIFQNYFQVEISDQETGYGIGLALSQQIVQLHHGRIAVTSDQGITCFTIYMPFGIALEPEKMLRSENEELLLPQEIASEEQFIIPEQDFTIKILLVEDNPELLQLLVLLLQDWYELYTARDGEEGLSLAATLLPDLVISDVMMPKKDGTELCGALKSDALTSHIPVILLTAMIQEADEISGLSSGADVYVTKPFNRNILLLHIRNLLLTRKNIQQKYRQEFVIGPRNMVINNMDEEFLSAFINVIEKGLDERQYDVEHLSEQMGMSQSVLYKKVRALTGMTINDFSKSIRLKRAAALLELKAYAVSEVAFMVGFMDSKYFAKEFKKSFGVSPSQYRSNMQEQDA